MYSFENLKSDFLWILALSVIGAVAMLLVLHATNEIVLPSDLWEKPGEMVSGFLLIIVMIGFIAGAFRSIVFLDRKWTRRTLIALGIVGFATPMIDIGADGGLTLGDVYEVVLPSFLVAAFLIAIPQLVYAGFRRLLSRLAKIRTSA